MNTSDFRIFLPRTNSKLVFIIVMSCYAVALTSIETRLLHLLRVWPKVDKSIEQAMPHIAPSTDPYEILDLMLLSPVGESLIMIGIIEGARRMRLTTGVQVLAATCVICALHSLRYSMWGFIVAPLFLIDAGTFVYWRRESVWLGALMMFVLHACFNTLAAISVISDRLRG